MESCSGSQLLKTGLTQLAPLVLIADDDRHSLALLERSFQRLGFATISCTDGLQALALAQEIPRLFLGIFNWMLPQLDGVEVWSRSRQFRPSLIGVLMIGRHFLPQARMKIRPQPHFVLTKPLMPATLDSQVRRLTASACCMAAAAGGWDAAAAENAYNRQASVHEPAATIIMTSDSKPQPGAAE